MSTGTATGSRPRHLLVATQGPWSGPGAARFLADAAALAKTRTGVTGPAVTVVLMQDATAFAAAGGSAELVAVLDAGAEVWVDRFSAAARALADMALPEGAHWADVDVVAEQVLAPGVRVVVH
ncbi:hypothetical protein Lesp02_43900 [Lentzea sp. NBRC 105346]|uniref:hypothetical protein n=1 Tax=Lentzea sp. NBRC 105346 TaxID=3032205 RepID=UPI0024A029A6|nr:hypothetical protein [Lentzea sp. NBRC 105346]GLZ32202.1 hypothetical protein Lesp02_43900 [Lentzea sp. NBRC 105346]